SPKPGATSCPCTKPEVRAGRRAERNYQNTSAPTDRSGDPSVALPKDPHSGGSGSSPEAPGSGHPPEPDGGPPPPPGFGVNLLAAAGGPHSQTFLHVYQDLKAWEKKCATLHDVCAAAGISPVRLLKAIVGAAYEAGVDVANMVASVAHPDVVQKGVEYAMEKD